MSTGPTKRALLDVLGGVEWGATVDVEEGGYANGCPFCGGQEPEHVPGCELNKLIGSLTARPMGFDADAVPTADNSSGDFRARVQDAMEVGDAEDDFIIAVIRRHLSTGAISELGRLRESIGWPYIYEEHPYRGPSDTLSTDACDPIAGTADAHHSSAPTAEAVAVGAPASADRVLRAAIGASVPADVGSTRIGHQRPGVPRSDRWARIVLERALAHASLSLAAAPNDPDQAALELARLLRTRSAFHHPNYRH